MTEEFIYNIRNIFCESQESLFYYTKTNAFYIGPYQRGYKWMSEEQYDQVPQLLNDIQNASETSGHEYYLQYITVKADMENKWLEVVDGQQRLTTLSLLFYRLSVVSGKNIALNKVKYSRYGNGNIFDEVCRYCDATSDSLSFQEILEADSKVAEQDRYYMIRAVRCIDNRVAAWRDKGILDKIMNYLQSDVKVIVNIESNYVSSEDIFAHLNDNKVPLTDAYLIKGLLITEAVKRTDHYGRSLNYSEIQEKRKNIGRMWDEIQTWILQFEHCHFFFKGSKRNSFRASLGMEYLLELAYRIKFNTNDIQFDFDDNHLTLFNIYNEKIGSADESSDMMKTIVHVYRKMTTIYEGIADNLLYNLVGFMSFSHRLEDDVFDIGEIFHESEKTLIRELKKRIISRIPDLNDNKYSKDNFARLRYDSGNKKELTNLLLSFSVFLPLMENPREKFRFYDYDTSRWSLEHISPQNPKGTTVIPDYAKSFVIMELQEHKQDEAGENSLSVSFDKLITDIKIGNRISTDIIEFLFDQNIDEHSLGNMALLTQKNNSANNNNPFMIKRLIIQHKKGEGDFIPSHTYEIFNKILISPDDSKSFSAETFIWNQRDVDAHISWMEHVNKEIIGWLNK